MYVIDLSDSSFERGHPVVAFVEEVPFSGTSEVPSVTNRAEKLCQALQSRLLGYIS